VDLEQEIWMMNWLDKNLFNSALERPVRKLTGPPDNSPGAAFCRRLTQVAVPSVDTTGMEVTSSGQKGIWVQWP
jgi:hypothetical protein